MIRLIGRYWNMVLVFVLQERTIVQCGFANGSHKKSFFFENSCHDPLPASLKMGRYLCIYLPLPLRRERLVLELLIHKFPLDLEPKLMVRQSAWHQLGLGDIMLVHVKAINSSMKFSIRSMTALNSSSASLN